MTTQLMRPDHISSLYASDDSEQGEVTLLTCYRYEGAWNCWQGFRSMGLVPPLLRGTPGLKFSKMLGSGGGDGFSVYPDWGRYFLLTVWEDSASALSFIHGQASSEDASVHPAIARLNLHRSAEWWVALHPYRTHGEWDRSTPFIPRERSPELGERILTLTRARIRLSRLLRFWRKVPNVSRMLCEARACRFAVGVGELPLIQQATLSIWESEEGMRDYAYRSAAHREVIKMTRTINWYSEELFARFQIVRAWGDLPVELRDALGHERTHNASSPSVQLTETPAHMV